jgi:hypothetical protein
VTRHFILYTAYKLLVDISSYVHITLITAHFQFVPLLTLQLSKLQVLMIVAFNAVTVIACSHCRLSSCGSQLQRAHITNTAVLSRV